MNPALAFQRQARAVPLALALASAALAPAAYAPGVYVAAGVGTALLAISLLVQSDRFYLSSYSAGASLLSVTLATGSTLAATAAVVILLVLFDLIWLGRSLFGIAETRYDPDDRATVSRHFQLMLTQAWRSGVVGLLAFTVTVVALTTPLPVVAFADPVSGSGLLALLALLLALLAGSEKRSVTKLNRAERQVGVG